MRLARHLPFLTAAAALAAAAIISSQWVDRGLATIFAANVSFVIYLTITSFKVERLNQSYLKSHPGSGDAPVLLIFAITLATVAVAFGALFETINADGKPVGWRLMFALLAIPLGWATIHMMAAIHYAHLYWEPDSDPGKPTRGLDFPGTDAPDGWDFVYFAFVIGMTAQTSDVAISSRRIRRFNLVHAIATFFFNTVIVASAVNVAVSLGS